MNAERLLQHFDRISEAPDAIPRLRRFILDLAVRGKLVEQDPSDEPAEELLKLVQKGVAARTVPVGWISGAFGSLLDMQYGKGLPARDRKEQGDVPVFGSNGIVGFTDAALTDKPAIVIGRKGSAGALNLCDGPSWTTDVAYFLVPPDYFDIRFLLFTLGTLDLGALGKGVKPGLSRSDAYQLSLAIPPLAEQHRIVAKVDELMGLCDQLEAAKTEREQSRDRLVAASLHRLSPPTDAGEANTPEAFRAHARFTFQHLSRLTTRPAHIKQLRQTILNLAVRGQLVPQDPNDEPASRLPNRINRDEEDFAPFVLPDSWTWAMVQEIANTRLGKMLDKAKNKGTERRYLRNVNVRWFDFDLSDVLTMRFEDSELEEFSLRIGDVLICEGGEPGRSAVWDGREENIYFQKAIHRVRFSQGMNPHYFVDVLKESADSGRLAGYFTGVGIKHFTGKGLSSFLVPLPPVAEQHRIVAKVDELMALCDQLEAQLTTTEADSRRLLEAVLHEALAPAPEETA